MSEDGVRLAKLFQNEWSQAVRLPVDMRFEGREVQIRRVGDAVILEPVIQQAFVVSVDSAEMLRVAVEKVKG